MLKLTFMLLLILGSTRGLTCRLETRNRRQL